MCRVLSGLQWNTIIECSKTFIQFIFKLPRQGWFFMLWSHNFILHWHILTTLLGCRQILLFSLFRFLTIVWFELKYDIWRGRFREEPVLYEIFLVSSQTFDFNMLVQSNFTYDRFYFRKSVLSLILKRKNQRKI